MRPLWQRVRPKDGCGQFFFLNNLFETSMDDIIHEQWILAKYGIPLTESNNIADFERQAFANICLKYEKLQLELQTQKIPT